MNNNTNILNAIVTVKLTNNKNPLIKKIDGKVTKVDIYNNKALIENGNIKEWVSIDDIISFVL